MSEEDVEYEEISVEEFLALVEEGKVELSEKEREAWMRVAAFQKLSLEEQMQQYKETGIYYGYPPCCIEDFLERVKEDKGPTPEQCEVGKGYGFIPCKGHTNEIRAGIITLESLITNRICPYKFPLDDMDVED